MYPTASLSGKNRGKRRRKKNSWCTIISNVCINEEANGMTVFFFEENKLYYTVTNQTYAFSILLLRSLFMDTVKDNRNIIILLFK